jgi:outer membrane protein
MQQRIRAAFGIAAVLLFAAALPAHAETKIAIVHGEEILQKSPQAKAADDKLKAEFDKRRSDLETQGKALQDDMQKFQRDGDTMSPDQKSKMARDLDTRRVDFGYAQQKLQEDFQARYRELSAGLSSKIRDVIIQVAKEKGYDLVLGDAVYSSASIDITDEVLKRLNAQATPGK